MLRILHTADWQLGMTRHFLTGEAQARYTADRLEAVRALLRLATAERCEAIVVAGDVFETNQVERRTIAQTMDALAGSQVPVYLLPGNHDPLDATSVYRSRTFLEKKPKHVHVLDTIEPRVLPSGAEIVGVPWSSKRPLQDLVATAIGTLTTAALPRVVVAHGAVDAVVNVDKENPAVIALAAVEVGLAAGKFHYLALGDRHSPTEIGRTGRVWYAGSQEVTDFDETEPGQVLIVEVDAGACKVERRRVGQWVFHREQFDLAVDADIERVRQRLQTFADKGRTVAKLGFRGTLTLRQRDVLEVVLGEMRELLAAVVDWERMSEIVVRADDGDFAGLQLSGYALQTAEKLRELMAGGGEQASTARDALSLLLRLSRRAS
jgi:DNA repair exonuclease SbcCD nuclease subunit